MKNKKAKKGGFGMILIILVILGLGWYFFIYNNGANNPLNNNGNTTPKTNPTVIKGNLCGNSGTINDYQINGCTVSADINKDGKLETFTFTSDSVTGRFVGNDYGVNNVGLISGTPEGFMLRYGVTINNNGGTPNGLYVIDSQGLYSTLL